MEQPFSTSTEELEAHPRVRMHAVRPQLQPENEKETWAEALARFWMRYPWAAFVAFFPIFYLIYGLTRILWESVVEVNLLKQPLSDNPFMTLWSMSGSWAWGMTATLAWVTNGLLKRAYYPLATVLILAAGFAYNLTRNIPDVGQPVTLEGSVAAVADLVTLAVLGYRILCELYEQREE